MRKPKRRLKLLLDILARAIRNVTMYSADRLVYIAVGFAANTIELQLPPLAW